jgi:hypothetical protein
MAKKRKRKYSKGSGEEVRREMHRYKRGKAKSLIQIRGQQAHDIIVAEFIGPGDQCAIAAIS